MKIKPIITVITSLFIMSSCTSTPDMSMPLPEETPFMAVVKLTDAEAILNFEKAKKYIDIERVFKAKDNPEDYWKDKCKIYYELSRNKKTRNMNRINFSNYNISETVNRANNTANVVLTYENDHEKQYNYELENRDGQWVVVGISKKNILDL